MTGSLQKRGKIYHAIIQIGGGKQRSVSTKCEKKADALKVLRDLISQYENGTYVEPSKTLFADFLEDWLDNVIKNQVELTTWGGYYTNIHTYISPYFRQKALKLTDLKPIHLQKYFDEKYKNGRIISKDGKNGISANYLKKHHANMKKCLDYAVRMDIIKENPINKVVLPKVEKYHAEYYSVEELEHLLEVVKGTNIETPVFLTVCYGLRRGEVLGLRWKDIDFKEGTIKICNTRVRTRDGEINKSPKTDSSLRTLPLIPKVAEYLKQLQVSQKQNRLLFGDSYIKNDYICKYEDGTPTNIHTVSHNFRKVLINNKLKHIRFHDLRHSCASYLLKNGLSLKEIQTWLGHSDISITANLYAHVDVEMKRNTANMIDKLFAKAN